MGGAESTLGYFVGRHRYRVSTCEVRSTPSAHTRSVVMRVYRQHHYVYYYYVPVCVCVCAVSVILNPDHHAIEYVPSCPVYL